MRIFIAIAVLLLSINLTAAGHKCASTYPTYVSTVLQSLSQPYMEPKFDERPQYRKLTLDPQSVAEFKIQITGLPTTEVPKAAFEFYLAKRLAPYGYLFKQKVKKILLNKMHWNDPATITASANIGAHRGWMEKIIDKVTGRQVILAISIDASLADTALYYSIVLHELEHVIQAIDTRTFKNDIDSDKNRYELEFGAVLAEWQYWQLIPEALIAESKKILEAFPENESKLSFLKRIASAQDLFPVFHSSTSYANPEMVEQALLRERSEQ